MADINVTYKGGTIKQISASGTTTLGTSGKWCEDDIGITYVRPPSYVKIGEKEYAVSTTSTTAALVGGFYVDTASDLWTSAKLIFVAIRDKVGKRSGYFLGSDAIMANPNPQNGSSAINITNPARLTYRYTSASAFEVGNTTTGYGVYVYDINSSGRVRIYSRYNETNSLTIDGTYKVEVYALNWPNGSPLS